MLRSGCFLTKRLKSNKGGFLQIPFSWLFAIIVGIIIIFFAIYAAVRLLNTGGSAATAQIGAQISVLLNPLETGFGEEKTTTLSIPVESILNNHCDNTGNFGSQQVTVSQKVSSQWTRTNIAPTFYNKYIFSNKTVQGQDFYLFSKPLELPFKVGDLIFLTSANDNYCFLNAPKSVKDELSNLKQGNLLTQNCPSGSINICFSSGGNCGITVNTNLQSVQKNGQTVYYETDALMYSAIFSDTGIYECQVQRLMERLNELSIIYNDKEGIISGKGCPANVNLLSLAAASSGVRNSGDLANVRAVADNIGQDNKLAYCQLW